MSSSSKSNWFSSLLNRLLGSQRIQNADSQLIRLFPVRERSTHELPLPGGNHRVTTIEEFIRTGHSDEKGHAIQMPICTDGMQMLKKMGWSEWPYNIRVLGEGGFGIVSLVYWTADVNLHLEKRRFAARKVQKLHQYNVDLIWTEIVVLRSVKHEHIIDYFGSFVVAPETGEITKQGIWFSAKSAPTSSSSAASGKKLGPARRSGWTTPDRLRTRPEEEEHRHSQPQDKKTEEKVDEVWMLLEFADAADLHTEIRRYENKCIPEPGARYYMKQICSALEYLHSKDISHNDLHYHNVLLKYKNDGRTKDCLICDFGLAELGGKMTMRDDVRDAAEILYNMLCGVPNHDPVTEPVISPEAKQLLSLFALEDYPDTVRKFRKHAWFRGPVVAPVPGEGSDATKVMNYVNPELPTQKVDSKSRWPLLPGRGIRADDQSRTRSMQPSMPTIHEDAPPGAAATTEPESRVRRAGRGRGAPVRGSSQESGASGGRRFGSWFRNLGKRRSEPQ
jgi:serine/threonine protein kinase